MKFHVEIVFCAIVLLELSLFISSSESLTDSGDGQNDEDSKVFTHQWAVHIEDGDEELAKELALKHGFTYLGEVCTRLMHLVV